MLNYRLRDLRLILELLNFDNIFAELREKNEISWPVLLTFLRINKRADVTFKDFAFEVAAFCLLKILFRLGKTVLSSVCLL